MFPLCKQCLKLPRQLHDDLVKTKVQTVMKANRTKNKEFRLH